MNREQARQLVRDTFTHAFQKDQFRRFIKELVNRYDESKAQAWSKQYILNAFKDHIERYERLGTYTAPDGEKLDILIVYLTKESKLEKARTALRNFVAHHLKSRDEKDAGLVAFVSPTEQTWRFSFVRMEYETDEFGHECWPTDGHEIWPTNQTQPDSFVLAGFDRLEGAAGWIGEPKWNYTRRSGASTSKASERF